MSPSSSTPQRRRARLLLPGPALAAARLRSGRPVVVCGGSRPGGAVVALFPVPGEGPERAEALVQIVSGESVFALPNHGREEVLIMVTDGPEPSLIAIDCLEKRPLWRVLFEPSAPGPALLWRGMTLVADPPQSLTAFNETGHEVWTHALPARPSTPPVAVSACGFVAVGTIDGDLCLVDASGGRVGRWSLEEGVVGLCGSAGGQILAHDGRTISAFELGRDEALWTAAAPEMSPLMATGDDDLLTLGLKDGGFVRVGQGIAPLVQDLGATFTHMVMTGAGPLLCGLDSTSGARQHTATFFPADAPPSSVALPARPIALVGEAEGATVFCAEDEAADMIFLSWGQGQE